MSEFAKYSKQRLDDRQVTELIGMARGMLADNELVDEEIAVLYNWLVVNEGTTSNPIVRPLFDRVSEILSDQIVTEDEREDLVSFLRGISGPKSELGEDLKPTTLPLCSPAPEVDWHGNWFCFTGTFTFGNRRSCEQAVLKRGGFFGNLTQKTNYLVIGDYVSDAWIQSSYGRKIEKAVVMRDGKKLPINIITEQHWRSFM